MPVCELCGNTNFVKQDGMFVCQGCGTKYSPEDAKQLTGTSATGASIPDVAQGVAAAVATLIAALQSADDFKPEEVSAQVQDVRGVNNYICQGWQMIIDDYKKLKNPTKTQLDIIVKRAKDSLIALNNAAMVEPDKYVQNTLIYNNCIAICDSVEDLDCYEYKDNEWKRVSFPVHSSDLKIPGQKDSWEDKRGVHQQHIEQEYLESHADEVALKQELRAQAAKIQEELDALKDEKKSKGFFNFAEKGEVKERMKPVKEQLSDVNAQIRKLDSAVEAYVKDRLGDLSTSFTQLDF